MTDTSSKPRLGIRSLVAGLAALGVFAACGGDGPTEPTSGSVEITASTTGDDVDSDGYTVSAGDKSTSLGVNGTATIQDLPAGDVTVELSGVAENCSVDGQNPRTVQVSGGGTATTTFDVACSARTGDMEVSTSTSGQDQDSDGYTVTVDPGTDSETSQSVGNDATVTFTDLAAGDREVRLDGVANNCTVDGENPRTVSVPFDGSTSTSFSVTCSDAVGDLEVSASTTGEDQDADGYTVSVDGTQTQSIGVNGTVTFTGLAQGDHDVELTGVASNCSVSGNNPRTVSVPNGGAASTSFDVSCADAPGDLEVSATTGGQDVDTDGYTVTVDPGTGSAQSQSIGVNGTATFSGLTSQDHEVELTGIRGNCSVVTDPNPRTVTVPAGGMATTTFEVDCVNREGDLEVTTSTTGSPQDPDGYTVTVDPGTSNETIMNAGLNETLTFSGLDEGDHDVEITGVADNCWVDGDELRTVTVPFDGTATTTYDVSCFEPLSNQVVFESDRDGGDKDIYVMNPDGSGLTRLTNASGLDRTPAVSPDGTTIAFASNRGGGNADIWLMNADGTDPRQLTSSSNPDLNPSWAPNGQFITFQRVSGASDIYTIAVDGTQETNVSAATTTSADDRDPEWDKGDGNQIAFVRTPDPGGTDGNPDNDDSEIYVMQSDGSGVTAVTTDPGADQGPSWDPSSCGSGTCQRLAFYADRSAPGDIFTVDWDGSSASNEQQVTTDAASDYEPSWSPSGSAIVFVSERDPDGNAELFTMNPDGTGVTQRTNTAAGVVNEKPDWSP